MSARLLLLGAVLLAGPALAFDWNVPKAEAVVKVGDHLEVNGLPLTIYAARSKWKGYDLLEHYLRRFEQAKFFIPPTKKRLPGLDLPYLMALDTETMWSYLVWVIPERDGTTTLILGAADTAHRKPVGAGRSPYPVFPGAKGLFVSDVELARLVRFTAQATEAEVLDFYRQTLGADGWAERAPGRFAKGPRALKVSLEPAARAPGVVQVLLYEESAGQGLDDGLVGQARRALEQADAGAR